MVRSRAAMAIPPSPGVRTRASSGAVPSATLEARAPSPCGRGPGPRSSRAAGASARSASASGRAADTNRNVRSPARPGGPARRCGGRPSVRSPGRRAACRRPAAIARLVPLWPGQQLRASPSVYMPLTANSGIASRPALLAGAAAAGPPVGEGAERRPATAAPAGRVGQPHQPRRVGIDGRHSVIAGGGRAGRRGSPEPDPVRHPTWTTPAGTRPAPARPTRRRPGELGHQHERVAPACPADGTEPVAHHQDQPTGDAPLSEPRCGPPGRVRLVGQPDLDVLDVAGHPVAREPSRLRRVGRGAPPHQRGPVAGDLVHLGPPVEAQVQPAGPSRSGRQPPVDVADMPAAHHHDVHPGRAQRLHPRPHRREHRPAGRAPRRRPSRTPPPRRSSRRAPPAGRAAGTAVTGAGVTSLAITLRPAGRPPGRRPPVPTSEDSPLVGR